MFGITAAQLATLADIATASGVIFGAWQLRQNHVALQMQLLDSVFQKIHGLEAEFYRAQAQMDEAAVRRWRALFMNALEYFAFLVNRGHMGASAAVFFTPAIENWYQTIVVPLETPEEKSNLEAYKELRALHRKIREGKFRAFTG